MRFRPSLNSPWQVALLFVAITTAYTWPLAGHFTTKTASDLGDPLFICWVLMWTSSRVLRFLSGDVHALADYWNANIFYPERLTLAYSEHFTGQMLQIFPIFAATGNIVLCYNLLFVSTFVLSGLGMYLFVREITGKPLAGVLAGVAFAFAPYRADQLPHLQVLSSQWMPFALYGFRRYFTTERVRPLAGASAALVMQVWSCGYYLFLFVPFAVAYCVWELLTRRLWRSRRVMVQLILAGAVTLTLIVAMLLPYAQVRAIEDVGRRTIGELSAFSADVYAFARTSDQLHFRWRDMALHPEGQAYPGLAVVCFALIAGIGWVVSRKPSAGTEPLAPLWRRVTGGLAAAAALLVLGAIIATVAAGRHKTSLLGLPVSVTDRWGALVKAGILALIAVVMLPAARQRMRQAATSLPIFTLGAAATAAVLAMGPALMVNGRAFMSGPYLLLYRYVPGFDGMRVPTRLVMVMMLFLSIAAGIGAAWLIERRRQFGSALAGVGMIVMLIEGWAAPMDVGRALWPGPHLETTDFDFPSRTTLSPVYTTLRDLPEPVVVAEFPFGEGTYDMRWTYMAGYHRRKTINGYSGFFPKSFLERVGPLSDPTRNPQMAWDVLMTSGVTHVVVHDRPFYDDKGAQISAWLRTKGAKELASTGTDRLFAIR